MRVRMGCFGWLLLGWIIIPCYVLFLLAKCFMTVILALLRELNKHNQRRETRKAYERRRELERQAAERRVSVEYLMALKTEQYLRWNRPSRMPYNAWNGDPMDEWSLTPEDDPQWTPN